LNSQNQWTRNYVYETANNRMKKHDPNQTLDDYTYDAHGNITSMPHLSTLEWDYANRLRKTTCGTVNTYYCYDINGERTRKVSEKQGGIKEIRYYLGGYEVFRKFVSGDLDKERQSLHIDDDKKKVALIETLTIEEGDEITNPASNIRYQYDNHLGSACLELSSTAAIISYEEYHPFGTTSYRSGVSEAEVSLKRYKYVGKERDEETGLYYHGARYYAAWLCRFVSVDPLQHSYPYLTPYNYAGNKPITHIDIDGMQASGDPPPPRQSNKCS
jgi:RHS repeat-associated protein